MKNLALALSVFLSPAFAQADTIETILGSHILRRFAVLADSTKQLSEVAEESCGPASEDLRKAYAAAFDAWVLASHLRFGPTEVDDRAYALAFWPDSRGATPRALGNLLSEADPIAQSADSYAAVSIAARGFYALELLLFDEAVSGSATPAYHCQLVKTVGADIALMAQEINAEWMSGFAKAMREPTASGIYRSDEEVLQEMFKSLSTGLQFTAETRLGRPLGTFDRPRPARAEARRSGRSARHVMLSLTALKGLAVALAAEDAALVTALEAKFDRALSLLSELNDPVFAGVSEPQNRFKIEALQQSIDCLLYTSPSPRDRG